MRVQTPADWLDRFIYFLDNRIGPTFAKYYVALCVALAGIVTWGILIGVVVYTCLQLPDISDVALAEVTFGMIGKVLVLPSVVYWLGTWIESDSCWSRKTYEVLGNIYVCIVVFGLAFAKQLGF